MGITHCAILNKHPVVKICAVADNNSVLTDLLKKYSGYDIKVYKNYLDLISLVELDALIICTPPKFHYPIAIKALDRGLHVFIEKPCTLEFQKALELSKAFSKSKLVNQVGYVNRFNRAFIKQKQFLERGIIGNIINFKTEMYSRTITKSSSSNSWRDSKTNGGGATVDMAAHSIDLMNFIIGNPDRVSGSTMSKIFSKNVEDTVSTVFQFESGVNGTMHVNWSEESYRKPSNRIEIFGNEGKIIANQHGIKVFRKNPHERSGLKAGWNMINITEIFESVPFYLRGNEFTAQLHHFVDCILNSRLKNLCTFNDAAKTLKIIQDIFLDYEKNRII